MYTINKKENLQVSNKKYYFMFNFKKIYGIGKNRLTFFYKQFGLNNRLKSNKVKYIVYLNTNKLVNKFTFKNSLKNFLIKNRSFLIEKVRNYKALRHELRYPVRGQRTRTNSKTRKKLKGSFVQLS